MQTSSTHRLTEPSRMDAATVALASALEASLEASGELPAARQALKDAVSRSLSAAQKKVGFRAGAPPPETRSSNAQPLPEVLLMHALIRDYFVLAGLPASLRAFCAETGEMREPGERTVAACEVGAAKAPPALPLLHFIVAAARAARLRVGDVASPRSLGAEPYSELHRPARELVSETGAFPWGTRTPWHAGGAQLRQANFQK